MSDPEIPVSPKGEGWDAYWKNAEHTSAYSRSGVGHPAILSFWDDFFADVRANFEDARIIDIASGSGAVVERALAAFEGSLPDMTCLDTSAAALDSLKLRFPGVQTVVADARETTLDGGSFDIATSQFGIEYAGPEAIIEITRLVAPGGRVAFLMHKRSSVIYQQSKANLEAMNRVLDARFIPLAISMFEQGFAAVRGANRAEYEAAGEALAPAIAALEDVMTEFGTDVADGTIMRLYDDVATIHEGIQRYNPDEVLSWLHGINHEFQAFALRMSSMCESAIDQGAVDLLLGLLDENGFRTERAEPLRDSDTGPDLAWALIATKDLLSHVRYEKS
jgi:ubiquinone/menaquinone biosynthesis C-methylase UbiE